MKEKSSPQLAITAFAEKPMHAVAVVVHPCNVRVSPHQSTTVCVLHGSAGVVSVLRKKMLILLRACFFALGALLACVYSE